MNTKYQHVLVPVFMGILLLGMSSCNAINNAVEDALKTTEFKLSTLDAVAADIMSDSTLADNIYKAKTAAYLDTTGGKYTVTLPNGSVIDSVGLTATDSLIDILVDSSVTLAVLDTAYRVTTGTPKISGFALDVQNYDKVVFYVTDYVNIQVKNRDGEIVTPKSQAVPVELSSACYTINATSKKPEPKIKARLEYELNNGTYLVKIIRTDQTLSRTFYVAVLGE